MKVFHFDYISQGATPCSEVQLETSVRVSLHDLRSSRATTEVCHTVPYFRVEVPGVKGFGVMLNLIRNWYRVSAKRLK